MEQNRVIDLINQSRQNNTKAFTELVNGYQALAFRLSFRLLGSEEEAKDAVQEIFIKVWLSLSKYKPQVKFSTWLYKIACNTCYDRLRVMQRLLKKEVTTVELACLSIPSENNIEQNLINNELKELIIRLTETLTPKQKLVFVLSEIEELEVKEIEKIMGLSAEKIKSNLYLARKAIKSKIPL